MVEGCRPIERATPLRLAFGQPPPLTGEDGLERPEADLFPLPQAGGVDGRRVTPIKGVGWTLHKPTPLRLTRCARKSRCPSRLREGHGGKPPLIAVHWADRRQAFPIAVGPLLGGKAARPERPIAGIPSRCAPDGRAGGYKCCAIGPVPLHHSLCEWSPLPVSGRNAFFPPQCVTRVKDAQAGAGARHPAVD